MIPEFSQASKSFKAANPDIFGTGTSGQVMLAPEGSPLTKEEIKSEKQLQDQIVGFLERNNTVVIRSRTDKATTTAVGTPDLLFALKGRAIAYEVKLPGKKPTKEQSEMMLKMSGNGWLCYVVESYDEAVTIYKKTFLQFTLDQVPR